jgi:outer membrane receptor for ferrienterochelin and colicins
MLRQEFPEMSDDQAQRLERYSRYQNSDRGDVKGLQVSTSSNITHGLNLSASYAYTYARSNSSGEWTLLERSIRHAATVSANYHHTWGRYRLNINLSGKLQSETYYTSYENAPGFGIWSLHTTHTLDLGRHLTLEPQLGIDNLFNRADRRIDSPQRKYALFTPGRMVVAGLKFRIR